MKIETLTIVGVGLIGGSIGLAARSRRLAARVLGVGRRQETLDQARALGALDETCLDLAQAVRQAEVAVFCTPVDQIARQVIETASGCAAGTLLTDAGSTKAAIVRAVEGRLPDGVAFVGSHPLAGSEKRGPEHARADLFEGRLTVVTPGETTPAPAVALAESFWQALGCEVRRMSPEEHDEALALTSHLPHLVAAALAGILPPESAGLTATGFRDTTRIAAGDPALWKAIFLQNRVPVLAALRKFRDRLDRFRNALDADDGEALDRLLSQAKKVRDALGN
jgi:prephenate dehydrogenase